MESHKKNLPGTIQTFELVLCHSWIHNATKVWDLSCSKLHRATFVAISHSCVSWWLIVKFIKGLWCLWLVTKRWPKSIQKLMQLWFGKLDHVGPIPLRPGKIQGLQDSKRSHREVSRGQRRAQHCSATGDLACQNEEKSRRRCHRTLDVCCVSKHSMRFCLCNKRCGNPLTKYMAHAWQCIHRSRVDETSRCQLVPTSQHKTVAGQRWGLSMTFVGPGWISDRYPSECWWNNKWQLCSWSRPSESPGFCWCISDKWLEHWFVLIP